MKKIVSFLIFLLVLGFSCTSYAKEPLDEILDYEIYVYVREDGTLDMDYQIEWKVLDDKKEGPLEWIKVGIPNKYVDEIEGLSDNIKNIRYYSDSGAFVRIDLDRKYKRDEILKLHFKTHQSYMFLIDKDSKTIKYSFTPGWFNESEIRHLKISWDDEEVLQTDTDAKEGPNFVWERFDLRQGEKVEVNISYDINSLNVDESKQKSNAESDEVIYTIIAILIFVIVACIIMGIVFALLEGESGGFGGGGYHGGGFSHCACVSSCACACACAGGGRAGCSKKDFYVVKKELTLLRYKINGSQSFTEPKELI